MALIDRYIFRLTGLAFLAALGALAAVVWVTQALKDFDLFAREGQTLIVFLNLTILLLPSMVALIAPIALFIAIIQTLQRLNTDSELVVMSAAGISPLRLMRPMLLMATFVALGVATISLWVAPMSQRNWRDMITVARAEFVSRIVREGQFNKMDTGVIFHFRKRAGDALLGLFIQDRRDPEVTIVYIAERGQIIESPSGTFLVLIDGSIQREMTKDKETSIIGFKRYALDLALLSPNAGSVNYSPRERSTPDLADVILNKRMTKEERGSILSEMTERLSMPLYAFTFSLIALAAYARPRSSRNRIWVALVGIILIALVTRLSGYAISILIKTRPDYAWLSIAVPLAIAALAALTLFFRRLNFSRRNMKAETA